MARFIAHYDTDHAFDPAGIDADSPAQLLKEAKKLSRSGHRLVNIRSHDVIIWNKTGGWHKNNEYKRAFKEK